MERWNFQFLKYYSLTELAKPWPTQNSDLSAHGLLLAYFIEFILPFL